MGRGHSPNCSNLSQHPNYPNTSLAACCPLSSSLPRGERTGWLLGLRFAVMEANCAGCFLFFRRPTSTAVNPSCFSNCQKPQNPLHPALPPWGRAGERAFPEFRQPFPTLQPLKIQALRLVALSLTLSHGREDGAAVGG